VTRVESTGEMGIGEMARRSGLSVSALRFYDGAGLLVPASVDPASGYRRYRADQLGRARVLANLRRAGLPLVDMARVLDASSPAHAGDVLDRHLRRLEAGVVDARRVLSRVRSLLDLPEATAMTATPTVLTVPAAALAAAIDQVRFAVSTDPELPALGGVLVETDGTALRLVTTDRFRLALAEVDGAVTEPVASVLVPATYVDEVRAVLDGAGEVSVHVGADQVVVRVGTVEHSSGRLEHDFPSYRMLLPGELEHRAGLDPDLRRSLPDQPGTVTRLAVARDRVRVAEADEPDADVVLGVDPSYLLQALAAAGTDQLVVELDGPTTPLTIRAADGTGGFSMLMPVRLDA